MSKPINCTQSELSTFLQALEAGYLATSCLDTSRSAPSRSTPIASKSYTRGSKTVAFRGFPSLKMGRVVDGMAATMDIHGANTAGNGQVPAVVCLAWEILTEQIR